MTTRLAATVLAIVLLVLSAGCPPPSILGTWGYFDCDGTPLGTVRFTNDGTVSFQVAGVDGTDPMSFEIAKTEGTGTWTENGGQVQFSADVIYTVTFIDPVTMEETIVSSTAGLLLFSGVVLGPDRIEGNGTSDVPVGGPCVVLLR